MDVERKSDRSKRQQKTPLEATIDKNFFISAIMTGLSIFLFLASMVMLILSSLNYQDVRSLTGGDLDDCLSDKKCEIRTIVNGKCHTIGTVPGCCEDNVNCTKQDTGANYAFNTICTSEIGPCDTSIQSDTRAPSYRSNNARSSVSNYAIAPSINFNSNMRIHNTLFISSTLNLSNIEYTSVGIEENVTARFGENNATLMLQTFGNFAYYYFNPFTVDVLNATFVSDNSVISQDIMPYNLFGNQTVYFQNVITYSDVRVPGVLALNSTGGMKFLWKDSDGKLNELFNCTCSFGKFGIYYFF